ncbi:MAG: anti-sigma factor family protein [Mycobacterium leprae]
MSHLSDRLASLVDGELDHDGRDRVLAHLAACAECRREADDLRALKARLARLSDPPAPPELIARLLALGTTTPARPSDPPCAPPPGSAVAPGTARPRAQRRPRRRPGSTRPGLGRPRATRFALAGGALAAAALGTAFAVGGPTPGPRPAVVPPVGSYAVEHAATAREVPFGDLASVAAVTASVPAVTVSVPRSVPRATVSVPGEPAR